MKEMLEHSIAKYKIPAYYQILDEFPVLSNGKADMLKLKEDLIAYVREIKGESNGKN